MKAEVDPIKCGTIGICVRICPQVFRFRPGDKKAFVRLDEIPSEYWGKCREAAQKCPNGAITITC